MASIRLPVIANGDIVDARSAAEALKQSGAAGVMIGRGATGRPWRLAEISHELFGTPYVAPTPEQKLASMQAQIHASVALYGEQLGIRVVRKHVAAFVDAWCEDHGLPPMAEQRVALCRLDDQAALQDGLTQALSGMREAA